MKYFKFFLLLIVPLNFLFAQVSYQGPQSGSVAEGHQFNTESEGLSKINKVGPRLKIFLHGKPQLSTNPDPNPPSQGEEYILINDGLNQTTQINTGQIPFIKENIEGPDLNTDGHWLRIPPDPHVAAGPEHVVAQVNSLMFIYDKKTFTPKRVDPADIFSFVQDVSPFDPKIIYDHFSQRWVTVWLHVDNTNSIAYILVAASDDSDPNGNWNAWAIPSNLNGNTPSGNWSDYQGVGFDDKAVYITSNQFTLSSNEYQYSKITIVGKTDLYKDGAPGALSYKDIWDMNYPGEDMEAYGIRPVIMKESSDKFYFVTTRYGGASSSVALYTLTDPLNNPVLTGVPVSTLAYNSAPIEVDQLGGNLPAEGGDTEYPLDGGGIIIRHEPIYINNTIYLVHNTGYGGKIALKFLKINTETKTAPNNEQLILGSTEHFHMYPNIAVSSGGDVAITFSRVSGNEYVGAYYTIIPHDFNPATDIWENYPLYEGRANYVLTLNGESNRWGDYNGAWSDPLDDNTFWIFTEYAKSKDVWGTRLGAVRLQPYDVPYVNIIEKEIDFGVKELSSSSLVELEISNLGSPDLLISGINSDGGRFSIVNSAFPLTITGSGSEIVQIAFNPTEHGQEVNDTLRVISNDPNNSEYKIAVKGKGFELIKAVKSTLYASSVSDNGDGNISSLDRNSAAPTLIGYTGFNKVESIAIHPETSEVYGLVKNEEGPHVLVKLRGTDGEGMVYMPAPVQIHRFAFDNNGLIHAVTDDSTYYTINSTTFEATMVRQLVHQVRAITVNPATNDVLISWAFPETDDRIVKLLPNGFINIVGSTGQGQNINTLTFDDEGNMYGTVGKPGLINLLLKIDPANGSATTVGNTNLKNIVGLAFASDGITGVNDKLVLPEIFTLEQNYPNPFNPSTNIRFNLPESGNVTLTLFNAIGEKITDLIKGNLSAGQHSLVVDASVTSQLSSGIYIYKLSVNSISGKNFSESKKMMLLK